MADAGKRRSTVGPRHDAEQALPAEAGGFVGRDVELAALEQLLERERLVTIIGPAGIGKTRCALRLARRLPAGSGGVFFVDLAHARSALELLAATAQSLGMAAAGQSEDEEVARQGAALAARGRVLLVLDNAEYVAGTAGALLASWLEQAPQARFLVTSIVRIGSSDEICFELDGLSAAEAVELYEERARRVAVEPLPDRAGVEELVRRLDRVPLAIELAAARARVLHPRQLIARLDGGFEVLKGGGRTRTSDRHASVLAAIRWSWELLAPWESEALLQCAVFAGGFTLDAAERVIELRHEDAPPLLDVLEALRDKSFLQRDAGTPPRFRLLESIRAHARGELERAGGLEAARERHARFFAEQADRGMDGAPDTEQVRWLVAEAENVRAAHRYAQGSAPAGSARTALALAKVLALRGPPVSEAGILEDGVRSARAAGDELLLARLLRARAMAAIRHGDLQAARRDLEESRTLAAGAGVRLVEAHVGVEFGRLLHAEGRFIEAREQLGQWIERISSSPPSLLEGYAANLRGMVSEAQGHLWESARDFEAAREIFRRTANRRFEAIALMNLGVVYGNMGRLADAASLYEKARAAFLEIGDRAGEADAVLNLGAVHLSAGMGDEAEELLRIALRLERELGNRRAEWITLANLGIAAHDRGELRTARELLQESLTVWRACGARKPHCIYLPFFAAVEAALGHLREARSDFADARAHFEQLGDPSCFDLLEVLEGFVDLADGVAQEQVRERIDRARGRLDEPNATLRAAELILAIRLLERAIRDRSGAASPLQAALSAPALEVGPEASWFRLPGEGPVDLRRRKAPRLIFRVLVERRLSAPGVGSSVEELAEAGWPGERALPSAASARVYVAVRTLRSLGLDGLLERQDDGYLLDPAIPLRRCSAPSLDFRTI